MASMHSKNDTLAPQGKDAIIPPGPTCGHYRDVDGTVGKRAEKLVVATIDHVDLNVGKPPMVLYQRGEHVPD